VLTELEESGAGRARLASQDGRRKGRAGLCELIPKVQTLPASYLEDRLNDTLLLWFSLHT